MLAQSFRIAASRDASGGSVLGRTASLHLPQLVQKRVQQFASQPADPCLAGRTLHLGSLDADLPFPTAAHHSVEAMAGCDASDTPHLSSDKIILDGAIRQSAHIDVSWASYHHYLRPPDCRAWTRIGYCSRSCCSFWGLFRFCAHTACRTHRMQRA